MSSKFFNNKHDNVGSRGKQTKPNMGGSRTNNKRMNSGIRKTGRGK
jgi:hypothetical protein